jgi:hypothetical protein
MSAPMMRQQDTYPMIAGMQRAMILWPRFSGSLAETEEHARADYQLTGIATIANLNTLLTESDWVMWYVNGYYTMVAWLVDHFGYDNSMLELLQ